MKLPGGDNASVDIGNFALPEHQRSGTCIQDYLYYNGYIPANQINGKNAQGQPNGVMGAVELSAVAPAWATPANRSPWIRTLLRLNMDPFNVFNMPGNQLPDANTGILSLRNSNHAPRQLQWTLRLGW